MAAFDSDKTKDQISEEPKFGPMSGFLGTIFGGLNDQFGLDINPMTGEMQDSEVFPLVLSALTLSNGPEIISMTKSIKDIWNRNESIYGDAWNNEDYRKAVESELDDYNRKFQIDPHIPDDMIDVEFWLGLLPIGGYKNLEQTKKRISYDNPEMFRWDSKQDPKKVISEKEYSDYADVNIEKVIDSLRTANEDGNENIWDALRNERPLSRDMAYLDAFFWLKHTYFLKKISSSPWIRNPKDKNDSEGVSDSIFLAISNGLSLETFLGLFDTFEEEVEASIEPIWYSFNEEPSGYTLDNEDQPKVDSSRSGIKAFENIVKKADFNSNIFTGTVGSSVYKYSSPNFADVDNDSANVMVNGQPEHIYNIIETAKKDLVAVLTKDDKLNDALKGQSTSGEIFLGDGDEGFRLQGFKMNSIGKPVGTASYGGEKVSFVKSDISHKRSITLSMLPDDQNKFYEKVDKLSNLHNGLIQEAYTISPKTLGDKSSGNPLKIKIGYVWSTDWVTKDEVPFHEIITLTDLEFLGVENKYNYQNDKDKLKSVSVEVLYNNIKISE